MTTTSILVGLGGSGYKVSNSLRFRSSASAYLNRTPSVAGNQQIFTWSGWVKRGTLTSAGGTIWGVRQLSTSTPYWYFSFNSSTDILALDAGAVAALYTTQVFRDPSAWYHIVYAVDTTQATAANRIKLYVNGAQVTAFGTANYPAQNANTGVNTTILHTIGNTTNGAGSYTNYFDGYLAEVNFIDGQALTPSSFGTYDANGVWQPIKYSGSFGTNGFYLPFQLNTTSTYSGSFNGTSQWISTPSSATFNLSTGNWTIEGWYFATGTNSNNARYMTFVPATGAVYGILPNSSTDFNLNQFGAGNVFATTNGSLSLNTWQHIALVKNGTTTTLYVDGIASGSSTTAWPVNSNTTLFFGGVNGTYINYFPGKISNVRVVMGTAVYTSNFIPSTSPLTAITNTQLLTLQSSTVVDNSGNSVVITNTGSVTTAVDTPFVANITNDASGNINNWFSQNISLTAGSTYDSMTDSPTVSSATVANYAVMNPLNKGTNQTIANGNLTNTASAHGTVLASIGVTSGFWYGESTLTVTGAGGIGFTSNPAAESAYNNVAGKWWCYDNGTNFVIQNGVSGTSYSTRFAAGQVWQWAIDNVNGRVWIGVNNAWLNSTNGTTGSPSTGANPTFTFTPGTLIWPFLENAGGPTWNANFGQQPFTYTPPTGFNALNTYNLPTPTIANGAQYMAATTYTGTGATQTISDGGNNTIGTTFRPDLIWGKQRNGTSSNVLTDVLRGVNSQLSSNSTSAESAQTDVVTAFNSNGYTVGASAGFNMNQSGSTLVAWQWNAGGTGVSNTNGSITSTVSANTTAGFSIVTYTGTGANATIGHGLGVAPNMVITKSRNLGGSHWTVYHSSVGNTGALLLDTTAATNTSINYWNNTSPTSSVFSVGIDGSVNNSGNTFVAYCWAAVAGYSAFGSYTGNGSTDGPFVYTGFRPRWVMTKQTGGLSDWLIFDTSRNTYNVANSTLLPDSSAAEITDANRMIDFTSNGFKVRSALAEFNGSGINMIYVAFAENPFNSSRAR